MTDTELNTICTQIYWHLERGREDKARDEIRKVIAGSELDALREFKRKALTITTQATIDHIQ